jgi:hypothetical protein
MSSAATSAKLLRQMLQNAERMPLECEILREARRSVRGYIEVAMIWVGDIWGREELRG